MKGNLTKIPIRTNKPRENGLTMVMDKGLNLKQAEDFLDSGGEYTDIIKLGFGTSIITPHVTDKIKLYKDNGLLVYAGGTLFEAFSIRNQLDDYKRYMNSIGLTMVEISNGSIYLDNQKKCEIITEFSKEFRVVSEVGSKGEEEYSSQDWFRWMNNELNAGSWKVIAEAREGGNIGIYNNDGGIKNELIDDITKKINESDILWEAPKDKQQVWFINKFGANVNLGNIPPNQIISLECLRLGLRADTLHNFLS